MCATAASRVHRNYCTACGNDFSSISAFDKHQRGKPGEKPVCDLSVVELRGERNGIPLYSLPAETDFVAKAGWNGSAGHDGQQDDGQQDGQQDGQRPGQHDGQERRLAPFRPCGTCGKLMRKRPGQRGRYPKNCTSCGGTGLQCDKDGTVLDGTLLDAS